MTLPPNAEKVVHEHQWSDWWTGMVAEHRYCLCGEAESRPLPERLEAK